MAQNKISIEVCINCEKHNWYTHHNQKNYDFFYDQSNNI